INQPLRRRHDDLFFTDGFSDCAIGLEQHPTILIEPRCQLPAGGSFLRDALCGCKAFRMLLEPFDAKEFAPNRFFSILRKYFSRTSENPKCGMLQLEMLSSNMSYIRVADIRCACVCAAPKMKRERNGGEENKNFCLAFLPKEPSSRFSISSSRLINARICINNLWSI